MKNLFCSLFLSSLMLAPSLASAQSPFYKGVFAAELNAISSEENVGARITLNGNQNSLELAIQPKMPECAEGFMCAQVMPEPTVYVLENMNTETDDCGIVRTVAFVDQRPVDGMLLKVTVNDNRSNTCPTFAALSPTDVVFEQAWYNRIEGREESRMESFEGGELVQIEAPQSPVVTFEGQIGKVKAKSKSLQVELTYGGGCKEHVFGVEFGACKLVRHAGKPVQECEASLLHLQGSDDRCKALITKTHTIDLSHLNDPVFVKLGGKRVLVK